VFDADLYSSTVTALDAVADHLRPGSFLYFDEFNHRGDEMRALSEFLVRTDMWLRIVGATRDLTNVMFQRL
jgi:hypothetical protein